MRRALADPPGAEAAGAGCSAVEPHAATDRPRPVTISRPSALRELLIGLDPSDGDGEGPHDKQRRHILAII
ncbi:hypothetical protein GCM10020219_029650 [Nonomuraea dietziae]